MLERAFQEEVDELSEDISTLITDPEEKQTTNKPKTYGSDRLEVKLKILLKGVQSQEKNVAFNEASPGQRPDHQN